MLWLMLIEPALICSLALPVQSFSSYFVQSLQYETYEHEQVSAVVVYTAKVELC